MSLIVVEPGLETRLVDFGRPGSRRLGVPVGGAADRASLTLANALVGNPPEALGLEIAVKGPTLQADADLACAIVGAPFRVEREVASIAPNSSFSLSAGQRLTIAGCPRGMRAYLCVAGGFEGVSILGSRSGLAPIKVGDRLECSPHGISPCRLPNDLQSFPLEWRLRVTPGPHSNRFPNHALSATYVVGRDSNRMGLRLDGAPLPPAEEMVSEPVCPGCIQITRAGAPIILGVDCQTIGGYPVVAVVIDADLDALGQIRPGDRVTFESADDAAARAAGRERASWLKEWLARIGERNFGVSRSPGSQ